MNHRESHQKNNHTARAIHTMMATEPRTIAAIANPAPRSPERLICSLANQPSGNARGETRTPSTNASTAVMLRRVGVAGSVTPSLYPPTTSGSVPTPKLGRT